MVSSPVSAAHLVNVFRQDSQVFGQKLWLSYHDACLCLRDSCYTRYRFWVVSLVHTRLGSSTHCVDSGALMRLHDEWALCPQLCNSVLKVTHLFNSKTNLQTLRSASPSQRMSMACRRSSWLMHLEPQPRWKKSTKPRLCAPKLKSYHTKSYTARNDRRNVAKLDEEVKQIARQHETLSLTTSRCMTDCLLTRLSWSWLLLLP